MTFNPNYAELLGRELQRDRLREASRERLIRSMTPANPSSLTKVWSILRNRGRDLGRQIFKPGQIYPATRLPEDSHSL